MLGLKSLSDNLAEMKVDLKQNGRLPKSKQVVVLKIWNYEAIKGDYI